MTGAPARGVVLGTVVLLLVAVTLLVHGSFLMVRSFQRGSSEAWQAVQARRAAVTRARGAGTGGDTVTGPWESTGTPAEVRLQTLRLSGELTLYEAIGRSGPAVWWAGRTVWRAEPLSRARAVGHAALVGGRVEVAPNSPGVVGGDGTSCGAGPIGPLGPLPGGAIRVGPLDATGLAGRLPAWTPDATACPGGVCPVASGVAPGPIRVSDGVHPGVFLVSGDLVLEGSAVVRGLLLVTGSLSLLDAARVEGAVQVGGDLVLAATAAVGGAPCRVAEAWAGGPAAAVGPVGLDAGGWPLWSPPP